MKMSPRAKQYSFELSDDEMYPSGKVILTACTMPSSPLRWPATNDAVAVLRYGWPDGLASAQARP